MTSPEHTTINEHDIHPRTVELDSATAVVVYPDQEPLPDQEPVLGQPVLAVIDLYESDTNDESEPIGVVKLARADSPLHEDFKKMCVSADGKGEPKGKFFLSYQDVEGNQMQAFIPDNDPKMHIVTSTSNLGWFDSGGTMYPRNSRVIQTHPRLYIYTPGNFLMLLNKGKNPMKMTTTGIKRTLEP